MDLLNSGEFKKLTITGYHSYDSTTDEYSGGKTEFKAMFNPEKYTRRYELKTCAKGGTGKQPQPITKGLRSNEFTLELIIDGTGALGPIPFAFGSSFKWSQYDLVTRKILEFEDTVFGDAKQPKYLIIEMGMGKRFCMIKSLAVDYTMFKPDGTPLRAVIKADFIETKYESLTTIPDLGSFDKLPEIKTVVDGLNLALMTFKAVGKIEPMVKVAVDNGLDTLRRVKPGKKIRISI